MDKIFGKLNNQKGFSLMEIVVTVAIFSIMMVLVVSIFARAISLERRIVAAQKVQENSMLLIESMAKEIRVSEIVDQDSLDCSANTINMEHPVYGPVIYTLSGGNINRQASFSSIINSIDVRFTRMNFCITGSSLDDGRPTKVTILLSLVNTKGGPQRADVQTTITSRNIISELQQ